MTKYLIEGNINFYEELYKSLDVEDDKQDSSDYCLISNQPLVENYVTMSCGHKFNYQPLFYDILNHKKKFNSMERHNLKTTDIRCPYCRNVQKNLLPYVEGYQKVHGVNYYDVNMYSSQTSKLNTIKLQNSGYILGQCCFVTSYKDEDGNDLNCKNNMVKMFTNNKFYCPLHMCSVVKKIMHEKKMKLKEEKKKAKEEEKMKKLEEKMKLKAENKIKKMKPLVIDLTENVVISGENVGCSQILKSGIKKGTPCSCNVYQDGVCKRHYSLLNKKTTETIDLTQQEE